VERRHLLLLYLRGGSDRMKKKKFQIKRILNFFLNDILVEIYKKIKKNIRDIIIEMVKSRNSRISEIGKKIAKIRGIKEGEEMSLLRGLLRRYLLNVLRSL